MVGERRSLTSAVLEAVITDKNINGGLILLEVRVDYASLCLEEGRKGVQIRIAVRDVLVFGVAFVNAGLRKDRRIQLY